MKDKNKVLKEINELFSEAEKSGNSKLIKEARKKAMRVNLKLPLEMRRKFCHKCNSLLKGRIRLRKGKRVIFCENCKRYTRIPFKD
jgi:RNase P subunit RPR2